MEGRLLAWCGSGRSNSPSATIVSQFKVIYYIVTFSFRMTNLMETIFSALGLWWIHRKGDRRRLLVCAISNAVLSTGTKTMLLFLVLSNSLDSTNLRQSKGINEANKTELKGS